MTVSKYRRKEKGTRRYHHIGDNYLIELIVDKSTNQFDIHDENYIDGTSSKKPADFNLHLALYLLEKEHLPPEILEQLEQWAKDNKMVIEGDKIW